MGWLDDLAKLWGESPGQAPTAATPRGAELIRLPQMGHYDVSPNGYLAGQDGRWISNLGRNNEVQVIELSNGNRMWRVDGGYFQDDPYIISTAGIKPSGEIDYCADGGCQYRAFANAGGLQQHVDEIEQEYLNYADWLEPHEREDMVGRFWHVGRDVVDPFARDRGFVYDAKRFPESKTYLADALSGIRNGIILADTTRNYQGQHLVAIRDGLQVVPTPTQLLRHSYSHDFPEGNRWLTRHLTRKMRQFEQEHDVSFGKAGTRSWDKFDKYVDNLPQDQWIDVWELPTEVIRVYEAP